jgi:hypothetical protein
MTAPQTASVCGDVKPESPGIEPGLFFSEGARPDPGARRCDAGDGPYSVASETFFQLLSGL